jgi:hypothetical protein
MTSLRQSAAYVDTTALLPIDSGEQPVARIIRRRLDDFTFLFSANLLEAEVREAFTRRGRDFDGDALSEIRWIMPNRSLAGEMAAIAGVANLPAARLWHRAVALFFAELIPGLVFITLDEQQEAAARDLGLAIA